MQGLVYCAAEATPLATERSVDVVASSAALDGHDEIVEQDWVLDRYARNPVVLYGHDSRELPIGRAEDVRVDNGRLRARIVFASATANPEAERVYQLFRERVLRGVSVGFRPGESSYVQEGSNARLHLRRNELYEISCVAVPSNPEALAELRSRALAAQAATVRMPTASAVYGTRRGAVAYAATRAVDSETWDGDAAASRLAARAGLDSDSPNWERYREGFAWYDASAADVRASYKLPHHDVDSGELVVSRAGVIAAGNAMAGSRGGVDIPESDVSAVRAHLARHYAQFELVAPWESESTESAEPMAHADPAGREETIAMVDEQAAPEAPATPEATAASAAPEDRQKELDARVVALEARCAALETARNEQQARADAAVAELQRRELDALVGRKITPVERRSLEALAQRAPDLYAEHLAAIKARPDMVLTQTTSTLPPGGPPAAQGDPGERIVSRVRAIAGGRP